MRRHGRQAKTVAGETFLVRIRLIFSTDKPFDNTINRGYNKGK